MSEISYKITSGSSQSPMKLNPMFDSPTLQITNEKLIGEKCYNSWPQSAKLFLESRRKMKYVLGTAEEPKEIDPEFEVWDAENSVVISWLLNSMKPDWKTFPEEEEEEEEEDQQKKKTRSAASGNKRSRSTVSGERDQFDGKRRERSVRRPATKVDRRRAASGEANRW
ncbi:hypothetical protein LWI29_023779 [Acer saccharum]|uniref:Retrotransposon Copia-like N-terminal domain-containing protein n=1 Tax=Acer saccharum TaxID=4024 RepID=A0AA39STY4_ACESA|nr:hypothetical protein LWI29_023779 [Acer saccharum]